MWNIFKNPFKALFPKKIVGIDIGTSAIKVVEVARWGKRKILKNYGEIKSNLISKEPLANAKMGSSLISSDSAGGAIKAILEEAQIKTKEAIFALPDFSTFSVLFDIPPMPEKEIPGAVRHNASQYIVLPISEVSLDWQIIPASPGNKDSSQKVFLIAVPNQVVQNYQIIAKLSGLELYALESEVLGMVRVLVKDKEKTICLVDMGVQSSTINIIEKGFLKRSYSFNFGSNQLDQAVSSLLNIGHDEAEEVKNKEGIIPSKHNIAQSLYPLIDALLVEIKTVSAKFSASGQNPVGEIYLTGGVSNTPGLREYFAKSLGKNTIIPNCFSDFSYPPILKETIQEMSPKFSAAVGVALSGLEA